jgi:hypothetical protein
MAKRPDRPEGELLYDFEQVWQRLKPMGRNQVYEMFRRDQIPGGRRWNGRWWAIKRVFDRYFAGKAA